MSNQIDTIKGWRTGAAAFWGARTEQERRFRAVGGAVVGLGLVYGLLIDPALSGRERLRRELPVLRQEAAELQALATQASQLAGQQAPPVAALTRDALNAVLASRGLTPQNLVATGEYFKIEFKGVPFAGLISWLDDARRENRIVVQDGSVTAQDTAGMVDATLTLRQDTGAR
jgi:general secretion pathway protein M